MSSGSRWAWADLLSVEVLCLTEEQEAGNTRKMGLSCGLLHQLASADVLVKHVVPGPPPVLTIMYGPHNAKRWSANFIEGFTARDHLPQNDAPAEHVTLLTVIAACTDQTHTSDR